MKTVKFITSFLMFLGILFLMVWSIIKSKEHTCSEISIAIHTLGETALLSESNIISILKEKGVTWEQVAINEIDLVAIQRILKSENYIKSVDKMYFLGSKLQIEVTLHDILLEIVPQNGEKFLLTVNGTYLPYSPNLKNDVITATGSIPYSFCLQEQVSPENSILFQVFSMATLLKKNPFYADLFHTLTVNNKQEIILHPTVGNLPVLFGSMQNADSKLKTLMYIYKEVIPFMSETKYAQLDVRFTNRIVAKKNKI